jgi:hypothetical protein
VQTSKNVPGFKLQVPGYQSRKAQGVRGEGLGFKAKYEVLKDKFKIGMFSLKLAFLILHISFFNNIS